MVHGVGKNSAKEYSALDKNVAFNEVVREVVKLQKELEERTSDVKLQVKSLEEYWIEEYMEDGIDPKEYSKVNKELFKIRIKEALKDDKITRMALEQELLMQSEARGE